MLTLSRVKPGINMPSKRLELYAGKLARTVLRGLGAGNRAWLPDEAEGGKEGLGFFQVLDGQVENDLFVHDVPMFGSG